MPSLALLAELLKCLREYVLDPIRSASSTRITFDRGIVGVTEALLP